LVASEYFDARDEIEGARSAFANEVFSMTMTNTCWLAASGEAVGTRIFSLGAGSDGTVLGPAEGVNDAVGVVAAGEAHATTSAIAIVSQRRPRIR
jgi:hypothetical protein